MNAVELFIWKFRKSPNVVVAMLIPKIVPEADPQFRLYPSPKKTSEPDVLLGVSLATVKKLAMNIEEDEICVEVAGCPITTRLLRMPPVPSESASNVRRGMPSIEAVYPTGAVANVEDTLISVHETTPESSGNTSEPKEVWSAITVPFAVTRNESEPRLSWILSEGGWK